MKLYIIRISPSQATPGDFLAQVPARPIRAVARDTAVAEVAGHDDEALFLNETAGSGVGQRTLPRPFPSAMESLEAQDWRTAEP